MSCGVGPRFCSDPTLLWLWSRPVATAPIGALAWEPPFAMDMALKRKKKKRERKKHTKILKVIIHRYLPPDIDSGWHSGNVTSLWVAIKYSGKVFLKLT